MRISVQGQQPLRGDYFPGGNSNAAIATIAAATLVDKPVTLHNVPDTVSTQRMLDIATHVGAQVNRDGNTLIMNTPHVQARLLQANYSNLLAASILYLAPLLARRGHARIEWDHPLSRIRPHIAALKDLGFTVDVSGNSLEINPEHWESRDIMLLFPSVTTTSLVCMLAAIFGKKTIIRNAASEPHLRTLQHLLVQFGAKIDGIGSNLVTVYGIQGSIDNAEITLPYDHIEIASVAAMSAVTDGQVDIHNVYLPDMQMILKIFEQCGVAHFSEPMPDSEFHTLHLPHQKGLQIERVSGDTQQSIETGPWPSFPSDLVAIATVLTTQSRGSQLIHEKLFRDRLSFIDKLKSMGAQIVLCDPHRAVVFGKTELRGDYIDSPDVRVGLGLLCAALCARNETVIDNAQLVDWTFENIREKLTAIGAKIEVNEA